MDINCLYIFFTQNSKESVNSLVIVVRGPMFVVNVYANALMATGRTPKTKPASEVCEIYHKSEQCDKQIVNYFKGIGRTCTYDSHCITNAYCKAQVMCACKAEYPLESEDKWYCDGNECSIEYISKPNIIN